MTREFFLTTKRVGFSEWKSEDGRLAELLWGDPEVTKYICASGRFSAADIANRLKREVDNLAEYGVQYWPVFELNSKELIGCCGLRPYKDGKYELGFQYIGDEFYEPTGLYHPSYELQTA